MILVSGVWLFALGVVKTSGIGLFLVGVMEVSGNGFSPTAMLALALTELSYVNMFLVK